jgi:hypothetical protein
MIYREATNKSDGFGIIESLLACPPDVDCIQIVNTRTHQDCGSIH